MAQWEDRIEERQHPILKGIFWFFAICFVIGLAVKEWYFVPLVLGLCALGLWGNKHAGELEQKLKNRNQK